MKTLEIPLPDFVDLDPIELRWLLAVRLYETGRLSQGQAAQLVGVSRRTFIEMLGQYGGSVFNDTATSLEDDLRNA